MASFCRFFKKSVRNDVVFYHKIGCNSVFIIVRIQYGFFYIFTGEFPDRFNRIPESDQNHFETIVCLPVHDFSAGKTGNRGRILYPGAVKIWDKLPDLFFRTDASPFPGDHTIVPIKNFHPTSLRPRGTRHKSR